MELFSGLGFSVFEEGLCLCMLDAVIGRCSWDSLGFSGYGVGGSRGILGVAELLGLLGGVLLACAEAEGEGSAVADGVLLGDPGDALGCGVADAVPVTIGTAVPDLRGEPDPVGIVDPELRGKPDPDRVGEAEGIGVGVGVGVGTG